MPKEKMFKDYLGNSPDLNPIKNALFLMIGLQWRKQATSKKGWKKIAWKIWRNLILEHLESLYKPMPCQMQAVVDAQDRHKKY